MRRNLLVHAGTGAVQMPIQAMYLTSTGSGTDAVQVVQRPLIISSGY